MPEPVSSSPRRSRFVTGVLCIALGLYPLSIAFGILPVDPEKIVAPMWVVASSGVVFLIGGCMILLADHSRANDMLAGILCLLFAITGAWVSLFGPGEAMSGGLWFLSADANVTLGRWIFGSGALMCFAISAYAFRRAFQSSRYLA